MLFPFRYVHDPEWPMIIFLKSNLLICHSFIKLYNLGNTTSHLNMCTYFTHPLPKFQSYHGILMVNKSVENDVDFQKFLKYTSLKYLILWFCMNCGVCSFSSWCTVPQNLPLQYSFRIYSLDVGTDGLGWNPGSTAYKLCCLGTIT